MRLLWFAIVVSSVVFACTIRTEFNGVPGSMSDEAGTDAAQPSLLEAVTSATGGSVDGSVTGDAAATLDAATKLDASSAVPEADSAADATASCVVQASDYDQTCTVDMDCVDVGEVLECPANNCALCRIETISTRAAAQYMAAYSAATASIPPDSPTCGCPKEGRPCCLKGKCQQCFPLAPLR